MKQPTKSLSLALKLGIAKALEQELVQVSEGVCRYKDGMTDGKIAAGIGGTVRVQQVRAIRMELFGTLENWKHRASQDGIVRDFTQVFERLDRVEQEAREERDLVRKLAWKLDGLIKQLGGE